MINYEKIEESQSYHKQNICFIYKKEFSADDDNKMYHKEREREREREREITAIILENIEEFVIMFTI